MGWVLLFFIAIFFIWYWWDQSPSRKMTKLGNLSSLLSGFIFEKLAEDIDNCKLAIKRYKENSELKKELKGHEQIVMNFLSMMRKHKEVKRYVYIQKSDKETLDIERDWYKYCVALYKLVNLKNDMAYMPDDSYGEKLVNKTWQASPLTAKEIERKFDEILLEHERQFK